jgi:uncharacterized protein (UPF0297 family)
MADSRAYKVQDLKDILTCAVEGGIGYWSAVGDCKRAEDGSWESVTLHPDVDGEGAWGFFKDERDTQTITVTYSNLRAAIDKVSRGEVSINPIVRGYIMSGDPCDIDSDAADCLVQIVAFGKIVYG